MFGESSLPPSLVESILLLLDINDIAVCLNVNRYMRRLSQMVDARVHERNIRSRHLNQMQSQFMKMGYMEGVERGRERLMQDGFNEGFAAGNFAGFQPGYHMGMLAALSLFAWSHDDILSSSDRNSICRFNDDVNSRIMHIGLDTPSKSSSSSSSSGEVEIRRHSKRKQPTISSTSTPREPSISPPRVAHTHIHAVAASSSNGSVNGSVNGDGSDSDDSSGATIVSAAPSTSRLVDLEDNIDYAPAAPLAPPSTVRIPSSSSVSSGPAAGLVAVNMDDVRRQCGSIATNLSLSIQPLLDSIRRAPSSLKHTRADDSLFGREDRDIAISFLGERQTAARAAHAHDHSSSHVHASIVDVVDVQSNDLDDDFM